MGGTGMIDVRVCAGTDGGCAVVGVQARDFLVGMVRGVRGVRGEMESGLDGLDGLMGRWVRAL